MGRQQGIAEAKLRGLVDPEACAELGPEERVVLRLADAMTRTPVDVSGELFAELRQFYDDVQIVEIVSALAWENYRARFDHALDIGSEGFAEGAFCPLPIKTGA